jgi:Spy/CpxP family protein refolding chaperone
VEVALQHRQTLREVITTTPFSWFQAQQVSQQVSTVAAQRMINRLQLRNQIFQVLTPQQQQQYIQIVQKNLEGLE